MKVAYVVAGWSGPRRYTRDIIYPFQHLEHLGGHQVDDVFWAVPKNPAEPKYYRDKQYRFVEYYERENEGQSYGSWADIFERHSNRFDAFIITEDDYVFTYDRFDVVLLGLLWQHSRCGYLGAKRDLSLEEHMSHSVGIVRAAAVREVLAKNNGKWPRVTKGGDFYDMEHQLLFSRAFLQAGWELRDFSRYFSIPFFVNGRVGELGDRTKPRLFEPVQCIGTRTA